MSYQVAQPPAPKIRPGSVTAAVALGYFATLFVVGLGVMYAVVIPRSISITYDTTAPTNASTVANVAPTIVAVVYGVIFGVLAITQVLLTSFVSRGSNPARIITWIVDGLVILCCSCGGIYNRTSSSLTRNFSSTSANSTTTGRVNVNLPSWFGVADAAGIIGLVLVLIVAVILLALPASHSYFRKAEQVWVPPNYTGTPPPGAYPGAPQYPAAYPPPPPPAQSEYRQPPADPTAPPL